MISNLRNLLMVRNIQKKNSRFGMNNQDINDIGFAIFSIEDGGVSDKNAGKFIYCNKAACQILCVSEEDVIGKSSANIMPELIRIHHDLFVKRFMQDGLTRNVGKVRNQYIRDFKGYIKPVQLFINLYYTSKFSYSFIMHMDPIQSLTYYGSTSVISTKHCMIFLCQDDNTILNMTENVKKILGLSHKRLKEEEEILGRGLKIEDVI
jgi:PAS domain S-box-containing protein